MAVFAEGRQLSTNRESARTRLCVRFLFRWKLYHCLYYLKTYPTHRHLAVVTESIDLRSYYKRLWRYLRALAASMETAVKQAWDERDALGTVPTDVQLLFGDVVGIVDTFPIIGVSCFAWLPNIKGCSSAAEKFCLAVELVQRQIQTPCAQSAGSYHEQPKRANCS